MIQIAYNVSYKLIPTNYNYMIPAQELKYDIVEVKKAGDDDDEDTSPISHLLYPYTPPKTIKVKTEIKNISATGKDFWIAIAPEIDTRMTIHSQDGATSKYKVFVEKIHQKTGFKTEFMCLIDRSFLENILTL